MTMTHTYLFNSIFHHSRLTMILPNLSCKTLSSNLVATLSSSNTMYSGIPYYQDLPWKFEPTFSIVDLSFTMLPPRSLLQLETLINRCCLLLSERILRVCWSDITNIQVLWNSLKSDIPSVSNWHSLFFVLYLMESEALLTTGEHISILSANKMILFPYNHISKGPDSL